MTLYFSIIITEFSFTPSQSESLNYYLYSSNWRFKR